MNKYARSWTFWLVLILVIIVLLAVFVGKADGKFYEFSSVKKVVKASVENIQDDIDNKRDSDVIYEISNDIQQVEDDEDDYYSDEQDDDEQYHDEREINILPNLPSRFMSEVSVGDASGIKRTKPERICRETLEKIYKKKFSRSYPEWLRNPVSNRRLELDCYNDELKIACEYNGYQHYVWPNHYKMTKEQFMAQNERDNFKLDACDENGVYLITVPYNVPYDMIPDYIDYYLPHNVKRRQKYGIN